MRKNIQNKIKKFKAFSLIEIMVAIIVMTVLMGAFTPLVTKKMKATSLSISASGVVGSGSGGSSNIRTECASYGDKCDLCDQNRCLHCNVTCDNGKYVNLTNCTCTNCAANCKDCKNDTTCKRCYNGFKLEGGSCVACESGTYSDNGKTCKTCPKGTYQNEAEKDYCAFCEIGTYSNTEGATSCTECSSGTYSTVMGAKNCHDCEKGYYCEGGSHRAPCSPGQGAVAKSSSCSDCPSNCLNCTNDSNVCKMCKLNYKINDSNGCDVCPAGYICNGGKGTSACQAGTYSPAGASNCLTCGDGFYSLGTAANCTKCSATTSNCSRCKKKTGVCTQCESGYKLTDDKKCEKIEVECGSAALKVALAGEEYCVTKYNIGDAPGLNLPTSGITYATAGTQTCNPSAGNPCCWKGTTSNTCNQAYGDYSGCTRTVCDWWAANKICENLTYLNKSWRLPTPSEWSLIGEQVYSISVEKGTDGLMLCDLNPDVTTSTVCLHTPYCLGGYEANYCYPDNLWSSQSTTYFQLSVNLFRGPHTWENSSPMSVRCIASAKDTGKKKLNLEHNGTCEEITDPAYTNYDQKWICKESDTLTAKNSQTAEVCLIGGGSGGRNGLLSPRDSGGGGNAGEVSCSTYSFQQGGIYTLTVGAGGSAGADGGETSLEYGLTKISAAGGDVPDTGTNEYKSWVWGGIGASGIVPSQIVGAETIVQMSGSAGVVIDGMEYAGGGGSGRYVYYADTKVGPGTGTFGGGDGGHHEISTNPAQPGQANTGGGGGGGAMTKNGAVGEVARPGASGGSGVMIILVGENKAGNITKISFTYRDGIECIESTTLRGGQKIVCTAPDASRDGSTTTGYINVANTVNNVKVYAVGAGGGGGFEGCGGGGGYVTSGTMNLTPGDYKVVIGHGGKKGCNQSGYSVKGGQGGSTAIGSISATGAYGGGEYRGCTDYGAGGANGGTCVMNSNANPGGNGTQIDGVFYGGGGGGGGYATGSASGGPGGSGGGGHGGNGTTGTAGTQGFGGGGGGGGYDGYAGQCGGGGGSGAIIFINE